jgi:hypothetical protein
VSKKEKGTKKDEREGKEKSSFLFSLRCVMMCSCAHISIRLAHIDLSMAISNKIEMLLGRNPADIVRLAKYTQRRSALGYHVEPRRPSYLFSKKKQRDAGPGNQPMWTTQPTIIFVYRTNKKKKNCASVILFTPISKKNPSASFTGNVTSS